MLPIRSQTAERFGTHGCWALGVQALGVGCWALGVRRWVLGLGEGLGCLVFEDEIEDEIEDDCYTQTLKERDIACSH